MNYASEAYDQYVNRFLSVGVPRDDYGRGAHFKMKSAAVQKENRAESG
jgi:hypothetical protein